MRHGVGKRFGQKRFGRFSAVGLMGAVIQLLLLYFATKGLGLPSVAAMPVAAEIALLHNFVWHERFTWRDRAASPAATAARLWRFHMASGLISLGGNTIAMYFLVQRLEIPPMAAAAAAMVLCSAINFLATDRWVFD